MVKYEFFTNIEGEGNNLVLLFNKVMAELGTYRMVTAPGLVSFVNYKKHNGKAAGVDMACMFFESCLMEVYFHSVISHLKRWKTDAEKYNREFEGSWKYYAATERLESIKEYGGEDEDYNPDGSLRTDLTDKDLESYALVGSMRNYNDIFLTTKPLDLMVVYGMLLHHSDTNILKYFKNIGTPIKTYRTDENGNMVENDWTDEAMSDAREQAVCDTLAGLLYSALEAVRQLIDEVEALPLCDDNKQFFAALPIRIDAITELRIPTSEPTVFGGLA